MSSWSLLLALSSYLYDPEERQWRFAPAYEADRFKCFFLRLLHGDNWRKHLARHPNCKCLCQARKSFRTWR
jgi:hypothetical protein